MLLAWKYSRVSHTSLVLKEVQEKERRKGDGRSKKASGLRLAEAGGTGLGNPHWEIFVLCLQAYSALLGGLWDAKLPC